MKIGFDECRICGRWIWRGDGEECCAPCLGFYYGKVNKKRTRRAMIFWFGLSALAVVLAAGILFRINIVQQALPWALILCIVMPVVGHIIFDDNVRDVKMPADGGGEEARDSAEEQTAKAEDKAVAKEQASEDIADIKREHKAELAEVKAEGKKSLADMQREVKKLQSEKTKLNDDLRNMRKTLEYYCARRVLDAYAGEDALRECGGIYVIKNVGDGKVKIGMTDNFARRFSEIQSHCASAGIKKDDVSPVVLVPLDEGKHEVERGIHRALADRQTAGEWFQLTPEEAVAIVLDRAHERRVGNFVARTQFPIGGGGGGGNGNGNENTEEPNASVRFGVDWRTVTPEEAAAITLTIADENGELHLVKDDEGDTPFHMAAAYSNGDVIEALEEALADVNGIYDVKNNDGQSPLMLAATHENMEGIYALCEKPFPSGVSEALYWVARNVRSSEVASYIPRKLLEEVWNYEFYHSNSATPLELAVLANNTEAAAGFIEYDEERAEDVEVGPISGNLYVVKDVSGILFDGEWTRSDGGSILHFAVRKGANREMVQMLLAHVEVNYVDCLGRTPLDYAVSEGHDELADCLREAGGYTCDEFAGVCFGVNWTTATPGQVREVSHDNLGGKFHGAPIHWAARFCPNPAVIDALAEAGADVNADSYEVSSEEEWYRHTKNKPIHWAVQAGYPAVIEALIRAGADVNADASRGKTPLDIADEHADGNAEIREVLTKAGAVHAADILKY